MKYFFPVLMALVIIVGLAASLTPFIAEQFFPTTESRYQKANPDNAKEALTIWFGVTAKVFKSVNAIRYQSIEGSTRWYQFETDREPVEQFIRRLQLQQLTLEESILKQEFMAVMPPVDWWEPATLQRQSYFKGKDGLNTIKLIYNAEKAMGYLLIESRIPAVSKE